MKKFMASIPWGLRERPFDLYISIMVFVAGIYILFDAGYPEENGHIFKSPIITWIAIYMMVASVLVMSALIINRFRCPAYTIFAEMHGWLFISSALLALSGFYIATIIWDGVPYSWLYWSVWFSLWFLMFIASFIRYITLRTKYCELNA